MEQSAIDNEVSFWKEFVNTSRFKNNWIGKTINPELQQNIKDFIIHNLKGKILDLGSGVVSILRNIVVEDYLVSCDPLANEYAKLFDYKKNKVVAPLPLRTEDLEYGFEFDIVHMRNALDHSQDPLQAYNKMYKACTVGGHIIISCFENEATHENWQGFHQWNLSIKENKLFIEGKNGGNFFIEGEYVLVNEVIIVGGKKWFDVIIKKV